MGISPVMKIALLLPFTFFMSCSVEEKPASDTSAISSAAAPNSSCSLEVVVNTANQVIDFATDPQAAVNKLTKEFKSHLDTAGGLTLAERIFKLKSVQGALQKAGRGVIAKTANARLGVGALAKSAIRIAGPVGISITGVQAMLYLFECGANPPSAREIAYFERQRACLKLSTAYPSTLNPADLTATPSILPSSTVGIKTLPSLLVNGMSMNWCPPS